MARVEDLVEERRIGAAGVLRAELDVLAEALACEHHLLDARRAPRPASCGACASCEGPTSRGTCGCAGARRLRPPPTRCRCRRGSRGRARRRWAARSRAGPRRARPDALGDRAHGGEIVGRRGGEARLDDVDPEARERARDLELLGRRHRRAGRLLPVAQRRIEDAYVAVAIASTSALLLASCSLTRASARS